MTKITTETETVIKKIIPYLQRRGYDIENDLDFETSIKTTDRYAKGYIDILVTLGKSKPYFLIEAKKISKKLTALDRDQAITYARSKEVNVPFVVVTNGIDIQCFNTRNKNRILWDGKEVDKIPTKDQLKIVLRTLKATPDAILIAISNDQSLPFRPGLPLRQLNALFYKCHSAIRKIEKNEESAFSDVSKLLFLKLLEEKCDVEDDFNLPYSYRFHELAAKPDSESDQVKDSILSMIDYIVKKTSYGKVLEDKILLKNPKTFHYIVNELSSVSFYDCSLDSKGAAFEYFVRATLKGKKLGQYFTPRDLIKSMLALVGRRKIVQSILSGEGIRVLDPACGTGGFLVFLMQDALSQLREMLQSRAITKSAFDRAQKRIKELTFYGSDANEGVAASAKMNMIIAGDGHTNIQHEDSLSKTSKNWSAYKPDNDLILTNPPFGTSESESLTTQDMSQFDIRSTKGQHLFIQKMIKATRAGGEICTVIDEGVLNTESAADLRKWILQQCRFLAVVNLPQETFKPNKINVKASLLYMEKRKSPDVDFEDSYTVTVCEFSSLGYQGSGDQIRTFKKALFLEEIGKKLLDKSLGDYRRGYQWLAFDINVAEMVADSTHRFDFKYWNKDTRDRIKLLLDNGYPSINKLNTIKTSRGISPPADCYVDRDEGYALVVKAGSNISKFGKIIVDGADFIEKSVYDEFIEKATEQNENLNLIQKGDILLSSTGDGTLGKCCVYDIDLPAIADGHVTIIRPDIKKVDPYYLSDYLRAGFGAVQINRLFTGSTGLIELTPEHVDNIVVDLRASIDEQKKLSKKIRSIENKYLATLKEADTLLKKASEVLQN
jgi:type I restriction enzyme M protein